MNAELKITGRLAEVGNLDGGSTPGALIYAGNGRYIEVHNLSEDETRAIALAFGEMVTFSIALAERDTAPVSLTDEKIIEAIDRPGFAWENLDAAEQRNLLGSIRALLAAAPAPIQKEPQSQADTSGLPG